MADFENLLLAKAIEEENFLALVEAKVSRDFFIDTEHGMVFEWMRDHWAKYGTSPTRQALRKRWPNYELPATPEPIAYYINQTREQFAYDVFATAMQDAVEELEETKSTTNAMAIVSRAIGEVSTTASAMKDHNLTDPEEFGKRYDFYEELTKNPGELRGLSTGYRSVDLATMGAQPGQLIVIAGPPKSGKSTVMLSMADNMCADGSDVLLISFEMSYAEQEARWVGIRAGLNYRRLLKGGMTERDRNKLDEVVDDLNDNSPAKLILSEDISSTTTVSGVIAKIQQHKPKAVLIDGVYLMDDENGEPKGSSQAITNITRSLKRAAQVSQIPVFASTQTLFSKMRGGKQVEASSVGYSSSFGQDADVLIGLEPRSNDDSGISEHWLKILLSRSGPLMEVEIDFDWATSTFTELAGEAFDDDTIDR